MIPAPSIHAVATGISGEIRLDIAMPIQYVVRIDGYQDNPTSAANGWLWPVLLGPGTHILNGLIDEPQAIYAAIEEAGDTISFPSNLVKVTPYGPISHNVELIRLPVEPFLAHGVEAYRLQITAVAISNMPKEIFVYRKEPSTALGAPTEEFFSHVCSPADLEQFPTNDPLTGEPPYYRKDSIDIVEDTLEKIDAFWDDVASATLALEIQLNELTRLERVLRSPAHSGAEPEPSLSSVSLSISSVISSSMESSSVLSSSSVGTESLSSSSGSSL